jgi:hypothetical protein
MIDYLIHIAISYAVLEPQLRSCFGDFQRNAVLKERLRFMQRRRLRPSQSQTANRLVRILNDSGQ